MAVHFRAFNRWVHVTAGALAALLAGPMLCLALADEVDEAQQICHSSKADPNDRIPACTRLLGSGRKDIDVGTIYEVRAHAWYLKGNFDNAIADYQAAINYNPKLNSALQGLGNSYFRKAEFRSAIKAYSDALAIETKSEKLYNNRGLAQVNVGEFRSAIKDFGEAIKINPKFAPAYNSRGNAYTKIKKFEPAIKDFTQAIEIAPGFVDAYISRAEVLINEKDDLDGGIGDYDKAISLDAKNWKAYSTRGDALRLKGDLNRAMADHEEAIRLNPHPESYQNRALAWKAKGDLDRAIADYDDAILLNPNYAPAYAGRGATLRLKGDLNRSLADLDKAVSLNPKSAPSLYQRGETLRDNGALDKAITDFNEALQLVPEQAAIHTARGLAYESKGDLVKARADFEKALKLPSTSDAEFTKPAQKIARFHLAELEANETAAREENAARAAPQDALADPGRRFAVDDPLRHGHALLIGNSHYKDRGWPQLDDIPLQLAQLAKGLKIHFDNVEVVQDIDAVPMLNKLNDFLRTYGNDSNARLFIYYAGHGYTEIQLNENRGYITGIDTPSLDGTQRARDEARPKAISMAEIRAALERAPAKSILFMFDSCFSGTIFTNRSGSGIYPRPLTPEVVARLMEKPARDIITAGQANEKVPAHSPIPELFLAALNGAADPYQLGVTSAVEIGTYLRNRVLQMRDINLTPLVGQLSNPAYTEGMFLFRVPNNDVDLPAARVAPPQSAVPRTTAPGKQSAPRRH